MRFRSALARLLIAGGLASASALAAATYYVDPAAGKMSNPGTASSPWKTLEEVFANHKRFAGGDVIILRNGFHGEPVISGHNSRAVTVQPQAGHNPRLATLKFKSASHWVVTGVDICPQHAGANRYETTRLVDMSDNSSHLTLKDSRLRSVLSIAGWKEKDWSTKVGGAVVSRAPHTVITGNQVENVASGIFLHETAQHSTVSYNVIDGVRDDGFRGNASYCNFEYNTLMNMYDISDNHDDAFQSFSQGSKGVGTGVVSNVVLRGNIFISYTDPKQPYKSAMQGIACFDGMYENWVIENNVIVTETYHGITLMGGINCRIVNNTVIKNPLELRGPSPWIRLTHHKNGTRSKNNSVRNNLTSSLNAVSGAGIVEHNVVSTAYQNLFANWAKFDFRLKSGSAAINAGTSATAPGTDADLQRRSAPYDAGAYEYTGKAPSTPPPAPKPTPTPTPEPPDEEEPEDEEPEEETPSKPSAGGKTASFETDKLSRSVQGPKPVVQKESSASGGMMLYFDAKKPGEYIEFTTGSVQPGTYQVKLRVKRGGNRGQHDLLVGGQTISQDVEHYGSAVGYTEISLGKVTVKKAGSQKVRLVVSGKHARSRGHTLAPDRISFVAQ